MNLDEAYTEFLTNQVAPPPAPPVPEPVAVDNSSSVLGVAGDVGTGVGKGVVSGALEAGRNIGDTFTGGFWGSHVAPFLRENIPGLKEANVWLHEALKPEGGVQEVTKSIAEPVTQVVAPGSLFTKGFRAAGIGSRYLAEALGYGAADVAAVDPTDTTILEMGIQLIDENSPIRETLEASLGAQEDDNAFVERLKNLPRRFLEGGPMGLVFERSIEGLGYAYRAIKGSPKYKETLLDKNAREAGEVLRTQTEYTLEEVANAKADTRMGSDIVAERLDIIVPQSERVAGGSYTPGSPDGGRWSDVGDDTLNVRGSGFKGTDADLERIWNESLGEVSEAARIAVDRTGATWSAFNATDWDKALRLPARSQLWYELSGEKFVENLPDLSNQEFMSFLDLIGATSARAKPGENLERALGVLSQRLRGVPVDVDLTIPSTVSDALRRGGTEISSDLANKTGMFSDTLALTGGKPVRFPISVNDVWVGKAFGISDSDLMSNQALHEVFAKYMNKLRDHVNAGGEVEIPHESWHMQARQWVQMRSADEGVDTLTETIDGSDYAGEWDSIVSKLEEAGINVPNGIITRDILKDPRFADALRTTTPAFRDSPKATVKFGTLLTDNGRRAADLFSQAKSIGDKVTQREYLGLLTSSMYHSGRGKSTIWEETVRIANDSSDKVTRIYNPTKADPFAISGTFEGAAAPNIRIPLKDMSADQIAYFNAMVGLGLKQKAMAAATIKRIEITAPLPKDAIETSSIRFDYDGVVPEEMLTDFTSALGEGFEISVMRYPDGLVFDINPKFPDNGPPEVPSGSAIDAAINMLAQKYGAKNPEAFRASFESEYGKNYVEDIGDGSVYKDIINKTLKGWTNDSVTEIQKLTGGASTEGDIRSFLSGKLDKLPVDSKKLSSGFKISSVSGKASTIRKRHRRRIDNHNEKLEQWNAMGADLDQRIGEHITKWEQRQNKNVPIEGEGAFDGN
tara:strand:+ start:175 stop:3081 length:2907 start_codon:yes stop_codon:yes gene_type:complete